jgi:hypothetical protein
MTELLSLPELAAKLLNADLMPTSDTSVLHEVAHALILRCEALEAENADLKQQIADAREACPSVRMQDNFNAPLLTLVNLEVSRGFNRDSEVARAWAENAILKRSLTLLEATLSERTRQLHGRED